MKLFTPVERKHNYNVRITSLLTKELPYFCMFIAVLIYTKMVYYTSRDSFIFYFSKINSNIKLIILLKQVIGFQKKNCQLSALNSSVLSSAD